MNGFLVTIGSIAVLVLFLVSFLYKEIIKKSSGSKKMIEISSAIKHGAIAFLKREYEVLSIFIIAMTVLIIFTLDDVNTINHEGFGIAISFVFGAMCSVLAGVIGMRTATESNVRTTESCKKSLKDGLNIAFSSGSIMGLSVVSLGLLGIIILMSFFQAIMGFTPEFMITIISGFGLGASSIALFARVGGGIYTKAADVGADLVGKVESGIPEDDHRNPAVIADNVGDNVGDVAGMGADLFESYVGSLIAAMTLGIIGFGTLGMMLPLAIAASGLVSSVIAAMYVKFNKNESNPAKTLKNGLIISTICVMIFSFILVQLMVQSAGIYYSVISGLIAGLGIGLVTEFYTSYHYSPTKRLSHSATTGAGTDIIDGLSLGYMSTLIPIILICIAIYISYSFAGLYGIALAAVGMLSTLGYSLATDAYGPVADNAGGIAEMAGLPKKVRNRTDELDSTGNTTAAIGKGFAIGSAALTTLGLFSAYIASTGIKSIDLSKPIVMIGLLLGGLLPFVFSAMTMSAVGRAAEAIVDEVRRQFKEKKGIMKGKEKPDYTKCIDIATRASLREMVLPGLLAVVAPILTGIILGPEALGGLLAGALVTGILLAIFMANAGGAWDNAKKYIELGNYGGKKGEAHKAAVIGDTVGDPFKDTSGPSLNILIKLMSIVSLVFVVLFI